MSHLKWYELKLFEMFPLLLCFEQLADLGFCSLVLHAAFWIT